MHEVWIYSRFPGYREQDIRRWPLDRTTLLHKNASQHRQWQWTMFERMASIESTVIEYFCQFPRRFAPFIPGDFFCIHLRRRRISSEPALIKASYYPRLSFDILLCDRFAALCLVE